MFCSVMGKAPVGGVNRFNQMAGYAPAIGSKYPTECSEVPSSNWKTADTLSGIEKGRLLTPGVAACAWRVGSMTVLRASALLPVALPGLMIICSGWHVGVIVGVLVGVAVGGV